MSDGLEISGAQLGMMLAQGLLIVGLLRLLGWLLAIAPIPRQRKEMLQAAAPLFAVAVCLGYMFLVVQNAFGGVALAKPLLFGGFVVALSAAAWAPIRDLLSGVFIKLGRVIRVGDEIHVQDIRGRVEALNARGMIVRTVQGEAIVPYGLVSKHAIVRAASAYGPAAHTFRVRPVDGLALMELRQRVRRSAMLCHWTSLAREPELVNVPEGGLEVTVYCVDPDYAPEVEGAVRRSLATLRDASAPDAVPSLPQVVPVREVGESGS